MTNTNTTLDELERLHAASTPGEWVQELTVLDRPELGADVVRIGPKTDGLAFFQARTTEDAAAIVALHNAFPALLAYVRALEAVAVDAAKVLHDANGSHAEDCNAYGADDEDVQGDPLSPDPYCDCGAIESRRGLRVSAAALDAARAKLNGGK